MLRETTVAFLGGGNMATAMIQGLRTHQVPSVQIRVSDPDPQRRSFLEREQGVTAVESNRAALSGAQAVVVAVKPNKVDLVLQEIFTDLTPDVLILSIAAGVQMAQLQKSLPPGQPLVRVMPNTPALIGAGISVLLFPSFLTPAHRQLAQQIMAVAGEVVEVTDEAMMDGVTALSGSGPAYLFLMAEALADAGVACGLPRPLAEQLTLQTLLGSARLMEASGTHPAILKSQVTSPGGTTSAALEQLEMAGFRGSLLVAVRAAWRRSKELSNPHPPTDWSK